MRTMTIEELLMKEEDATLLNIHDELESGVVPATSYAHEFVRKVNRMIDEGKLCVRQGKYRNVYLPSIAQAVYKEMARRYAMYCYGAKSTQLHGQLVFESVPDGAADDDVCRCSWCNGEYDASDLIPTDLGMICEQCVTAIRSRGEDIAVLR